MSELRRKAVPGIVGVFCLFTAMFLLTEGSDTYDLSEWESEQVLLSSSAKVSAEGAIFSNDRSRKLDESVSEVSGDQSKTDGSKADSAVFEKVSEDSWVRHAVAGLASEELPDLESELAKNKPVTRYELAVIIARVIEKLQNGQNGAVEASYPKVAMLEKLSVEFRQELDILGVSSRRFNARVSKVEQKVASMDRSLRVLGQQIDKVGTQSSKVAAESRKTIETARGAKNDVEFLQDMIRQQNMQVESGEKQLKNMGKIISRLLVKVALNDARLKSVTPDGVEKGRRDIGAIAKAVSGIQKKVQKIDSRTMACDQRVDALSRNSVNKQPAQVSTQALAGIKGLLKDFFTSYETRLRTVEQKAL